MSDFMPSNGAGELLLSFFDWGYRTPQPVRAGATRAAKRLDAIRKHLAGLFAVTPTHGPTRQVRRRAAISLAKRLSDRKHNWRDFLETLAEAKS